VTQVLSELEFQVEACNEPFATVKKLTAERFDAVVVDCENEQNATLLFKSARNSGSNQASLSIAVVEGQAGVATAFRIGANLVLTKPINVEQSKGTIRVARGLLRKSESAKAAGTFGSGDQPAPTSAAGMRAPFSKVSTPAVASSFELEHEPEPQPEPTEAALLESMPDPAANLGRVAATVPAPKTSPWQPISKPMATALRNAADATGHSESSASRASSANPPFATLGSGAGAAAAPAQQKERVREKIGAHEIELPSFATLTDKSRSPLSSDAGTSKKTVLIVAVVLLVVTAGYIGWKKTHYRSILNFLHRPAPRAQTVQPSVPPAHSPAPSPEQIAIPTAPLQMDTDLSAVPLPPTREKSSLEKEMLAPKPKKTASPVASRDEDESAVETNAPDAIVVKKGDEKAIPHSPAPQDAPEATAPGVLSVAQESPDGAISGLVNVSPSVPHVAPQTLKVSQGVSQGLLVKKVAPVYPQQALQMKVHGAVEIMATISKDGDITNVKLLSGDALLGRAAMDAVKQWKYKPYYLDSQPVDIQTQITVNFKLP
jgi:protein TonB